ncbi:hypothetical protein P261_00062 [Lachnospiraceae bacterium TWA4]|nr:hypothetical protein P261_00062 [Lachnospiraceae bacterium TWA4]
MEQLENLRKNWTKEYFNKEEAMNLWDNQARQGCYMKIPSIKENKFLQLLQNEGMLQPNFHVLDIGCGGGAYSLSIAPFVHSVTGCDFSKEMIANAKSLTTHTPTINNVNFEVIDWHTLSIKDKGWSEKFDVAFAHMSPAVADVDTLEKLVNASKGYCVITKPTRRTDSILDTVKEMVGLEETRTDVKKDIPYIFEYTWLSGYRPKIMYEPQTWIANRTIEESFVHYTSRIGQFMDLSNKQKEIILDYLHSISKNGQIEEMIKSLTVTIYWNKNER